ncbi:MAG: hypothetical protein UE295_06075 [Acutalibacteraceae bacterium]|nr:hypothetical protein [Acutalibacteraceae bacterium]
MTTKKTTDAKELSETPVEQLDSVQDAHRSQGDWIESHVADELMDYLIASMCEGLRCSGKKDNNQLANYTIEYLVDNLPAVNFVVTFYTQLIIGGGLIAKDTSNQLKLDAWLKQKNVLGQTNREIIADSVKNSLMYGYSGIRLSLGDFYPIAPSQFRIWKLPYCVVDKRTGTLRPIPGIRSVALYEVNQKKDFKVEKDKERVFAVGNHRYTLEEVLREKLLKQAYDGSYYLDDGEDGATVSTVYLDPENFCHLRNSDDGDYGRSPLSYDKLRTSLLIDLLINFRDEILNDGTDYIMYLKARNDVGAALTSAFSQRTLNDSAIGSMDKRMVKTAEEKQMEAARKMALQMKKSKKTRMTIARHDQIDEIAKLDGTVHLPDYLGVYNDAKDVVADIYGIHSLLVGGRSSGWNTGMSSMLEFTMDKTIKPFQQRYSEQLSEYIARAAGLKGNVSFKEYDLLDEKTRAEIEKLAAEVDEKTANAAKIAKETKLMKSQTVNQQNQQKPQNNNQNNSNKSSTK